MPMDVYVHLAGRLAATLGPVGDHLPAMKYSSIVRTISARQMPTPDGHPDEVLALHRHHDLALLDSASDKLPLVYAHCATTRGAPGVGWHLAQRDFATAK